MAITYKEKIGQAFSFLTTYPARTVFLFNIICGNLVILLFFALGLNRKLDLHLLAIVLLAFNFFALNFIYRSLNKIEENCRQWELIWEAFKCVIVIQAITSYISVLLIFTYVAVTSTDLNLYMGFISAIAYGFFGIINSFHEGGPFTLGFIFANSVLFTLYYRQLYNRLPNERGRSSS